MFKQGEKIKIIDDNQVAVVIRVQKNKITVLNEFGFEETYYASELIPFQDLLVGEFIKPKEEITKVQNAAPSPDKPKEIDLHIGQLVDYTSGLSNFEMLEIQLNKVKDEIELARIEKRSRLIFIHGHGSGKLREEIHKYLKSQSKLEFYDASFRKYKLGATEVRLF